MICDRCKQPTNKYRARKHGLYADKVLCMVCYDKVENSWLHRVAVKLGLVQPED